jgi:hypothetical protein
MILMVRDEIKIDARRVWGVKDSSANYIQV